MAAMRRNTAVFAVFLLVAPLAARLAAASSDLESTRCALACVRAGMAAEKGAACCPMGHGAAVPTLASCSHEGDAVPLRTAPPMLLVAGLFLTLPSLSRRTPLAPAFALPWPPSRLPDKVPLLLG